MKNKKTKQSMKKYSKLMGLIGLISGVGMIFLFAAPFYNFSANYGIFFINENYTGFDHLFKFNSNIYILISLSFISLLIAIVLSAVQMKFEKVNWITAIFFLISAFNSIVCTLGYYDYTLRVGAILVFVFGLIFGLLDGILFLVSFFKHLGD